MHQDKDIAGLVSNIATIKTNCNPDSIKKCLSQLTTIQSLSNLIGTQKDSANVRKNINKIIYETRILLTNQKNYLKKVKANPRISCMITSDRMHEALINSANDLLKISEDISKKESENPLPRPISNKQEEFTPEQEEKLLQQQKLVELELIEERKKQMLKIERDALDLLDISKLLNKIVADSGNKIEKVEDNLEKTEDSIVKGNEELKTAVIGKRKFNNRIILLTAIFIFVLILIISIVSVPLFLKFHK